MAHNKELIIFYRNFQQSMKLKFLASIILALITLPQRSYVTFLLDWSLIHQELEPCKVENLIVQIEYFGAIMVHG